MPVDEEFERLKDKSKLPGRKHLSVLNTTAEPTDAFVLEDEGKRPCEGPVDVDTITERVIAALRTVYDPEIPLNLYDLGLIYGHDVDANGSVHIRMTLTAPGCPVAGSLVRDVHERVRDVEGVRHAKTELIWDPPWTRDRMSEAAQLELGLL